MQGPAVSTHEGHDHSTVVSSAPLRTRCLRGLEDLFERSLDLLARRMSRRRVTRLLDDPGYLGGRECHCPPGLPLHLLHSEGIREECDFVVDHGSNVEHRRRKQIPVEFLAPAARAWGPGAVIHVKADLLDRFVQHVLPVVVHPIVLVTGDSDFAPVRAFAPLLDHPRIAHWFAQNCDLPTRHPRLTRLPIGVDNPVFTRLEKRLGFFITMLLGRTPFDPTCSRNDMGDQGLLQHVRSTLPPAGERPLRVLCTFHRSGRIVPDMENVPGRLEAYREVEGNPLCWLAPARLRQEACWRIHGKFAFEVSPRGRGLDCFRTWEALLLGCIPIVLSSPLDPLYEDEALPMAVVESWREITPSNLERWHARLQDRFNEHLAATLTVDFWMARIRAESLRAGGKART